MRLSLAGSLLVLSTVAVLADSSSDRARLAGAWQLQADHGNSGGVVWNLESKDDAIRISCSENGQKVADFECNTMGRECEVKDSGRQAKVSMWFSGPKLVELETRGSQVIKRRFAAVDGGEAMEIEVIPVVPAGKTEVLRFKRMQVSEARK